MPTIDDLWESLKDPTAWVELELRPPAPLTAKELAWLSEQMERVTQMANTLSKSQNATLLQKLHTYFNSEQPFGSTLILTPHEQDTFDSLYAIAGTDSHLLIATAVHQASRSIS